MSILIVGSVVLDTVETPHGKKNDILGGSGVFASYAASLLAQTSLVGIVGDDFPEEYHGKLCDRGICLDGLAVEEGTTFRWSGRYSGNMAVVDTLDTQLGVFESFDPQIPEDLRRSRIVLLESIQPDLQLNVLEQANAPELVAMDTIRLWINTKPEEVKQVIRRSNLVILNDEEVRSITGEHQIVKAAEILLSWGPANVIVKRGEHGASLFGEAGPFSLPAFPTSEVKDPTGAGDSFAGGFLGFLARDNGPITPARMKQAMVVGTAVASFTVEDFSIDRLENLTLEDVVQRCRVIRKQMSCEEIVF